MNSEQDWNRLRNPIAIVGFSVRAAAQCAARQGFDVVAVDMCADRDLLNRCHTHIRLDDLNWPTILNERFAGVSLLLTGGMENRLECVDRCHAVSRRPGPTGEQLASMRRLENWAKWAQASEIGWPKTVLDSHEAARLLRETSDDRWLLKSMASAGGSGTVELSVTELQNEPYFLERKAAYVQKRISGENIGITFLSCEFGTSVVGAAKAWDADDRFDASKFAYRGSCGPIALSNDLASKVQKFGDLATRESKLLGLWQADFILNNGNLFLLEINPRWSASMDLLDVSLKLPLITLHHASICASLSQQAFEQFSESCLQGMTEHRDAMLGKFIVYAEEPLTVTEALSDYWWENRWESEFSMPPIEHKHYFADIPCQGTLIAKQDPILTVLTTGACSNSIFEALQTAQSNALLP